MINKIVNKSGFALVEVVVGIALLTVTFLAVGNLLVSSLRANQATTNSFAAYNLAEEGMELLRNVRDSNWARNVVFDGDIKGFETKIAGKFADCQPGMEVFKGYYLISLHPSSYLIELEKANLPIIEDEDDKKDFFTAIKDNKYFTALVKYDSGGKFIYSNKRILTGMKQEKSRYSRYIFIEKDCKKPMEVKAASTVVWWEKWSKSDNPEKVEIFTVLTDWRGGAL